MRSARAARPRACGRAHRRHAALRAANAPRRSRSWCTRRPAAIRSSRSSFSPRSPKKDCSRSITTRRAGPGISIAFTPRDTPTTWWISWSASSAACRRTPGGVAAAGLPGQRRRHRDALDRPRDIGGAVHAALGRRVRQELIERWQGLPVRPRSRSGGRLFADPRGAARPKRICGSAGCSRRTHLPRSGRRRSSTSSINSTAARP